jgi:hypothetical protein
MLARTLEATLASATAKTDLSQRMPDDMPLRFENLHGYRLLPFGRTKNATHLSVVQIATAILATATVQPGFAGLAGKILSSLRPVGGVEASFQGCETLGCAIERLLENATARNALLEVRVSDSEIYTNAHGRASITYTDGGGVKIACWTERGLAAPAGRRQDLQRQRVDLFGDYRDGLLPVVVSSHRRYARARKARATNGCCRRPA